MSADAAPPGTSLRERVQEALNKTLPYIQGDGGNVEIVNVNEEDGIVFIRFQGACTSCPSSAVTLQLGIEAEILKAVPEIKEVIPV